MQSETYILKFGKNKGKSLSEVDPQYLKWMLENDSIFESVRSKVKEYIETNNININDKPFVFNFGKYKGKSIEEINDDAYLKWLLNNPKTYDAVKIKIRRYLNNSTEEELNL